MKGDVRNPRYPPVAATSTPPPNARIASLTPRSPGFWLGEVAGAITADRGLDETWPASDETPWKQMGNEANLNLPKTGGSSDFGVWRAVVSASRGCSPCFAAASRNSQDGHEGADVDRVIAACGPPSRRTKEVRRRACTARAPNRHSVAPGGELRWRTDLAPASRVHRNQDVAARVRVTQRHDAGMARTLARPTSHPVFPCKSALRSAAFESACGGSILPGHRGCS